MKNKKSIIIDDIQSYWLGTTSGTYNSYVSVYRVMSYYSDISADESADGCVRPVIEIYTKDIK